MSGFILDTGSEAVGEVEHEAIGEAETPLASELCDHGIIVEFVYTDPDMAALLRRRSD